MPSKALTDRAKIKELQKSNPVSRKPDKKIKIPRIVSKERLLTNKSASVGNRIKRNQEYGTYLKAKKQEQKRKFEVKKKIEKETGEKPAPVREQRTIEKLRVKDETIVEPDDEEIMEDEQIDEFAEYFDGKPPHTLITSSYRDKPSKSTLEFMEELLDVFDNSEYYKRGSYELKEIVKYSINREFTDIIVINQDKKDKNHPNALTLIHLPNGPTATFKLSSIEPRRDIENHGKPTDHKPEVILNNFTTRLGHTIGRMFASLFPQLPEFVGRRVGTFHNQRDYIFFRHHRYEIADEKNGKQIVRLQECGPRFCLKLRSLQKGTFDTKFGEFVFVSKHDQDVNKRRFYL